MADIHYFVSEQKGCDDKNSGTSPKSPWATLTKAMQTVQTPAAGNRHIVHWGPGTYREKLSFVYAGRSLTDNIIYAPDPDCVYLVNDAPGRCRVTGCDYVDRASSGIIVDWNNKDFVQFGCDEATCWIDGSKTIAMRPGTGSGRTLVKANVSAGQYAVQGGHNVNCTAIGGYTVFQGGVCINCVALGGRHGFSNCDSVNCAVFGGVESFYYGNHTNGMAVGSYTGFSKGLCENCIALHSYEGFRDVEVYDCLAASCYTDSTGNMTGDGEVSDGPVAIGRIGAMPYFPNEVQRLGKYVSPNSQTNEDCPRDDIDGRRRANPPSIGPWESPRMDIMFDPVYCYETLPAIVLRGHSMYIMKVPVTEGKPVTIRWWVLYDLSTDSGMPPAIWLRGAGIETQVATCTVEIGDWQQLEVSATPTVDTVLECCLFAKGDGYDDIAIFSDPEVG